jgi:4-aminobutyrate aminotransferase-like enzyme
MLSRAIVRRALVASRNNQLAAASASFTTTASSHASNFGVSEFGKTHVARGIGRLTDAVITSGKGSYITLNDERGEYLDFTSGIGVTGLGKLWILR